jgi:hypothetical protein
LINEAGKPRAEFVTPGHPLLESTSDLILERYRGLLKRGSILIDANDRGTALRALVYLEHAIQDARLDRGGHGRIVSRQLQFVEIDTAGKVRPAGYAPYLDYRPATQTEAAAIRTAIDEAQLGSDLERLAIDFAITELVPQHFDEVSRRRIALVDRTLAAVRDRLTKEIAHWDNRANYLREQEEAGKQPKMNWQRARERANDLEARLLARTQELELERKVSPAPPIVLGGAIVVPLGLVDQLSQPKPETVEPDEQTRRIIEQIAMREVMAAERALGHEPTDVSMNKLGYDVESRVPATGRLRFIEVEVITALNKPEDFILAIVVVDGERASTRYISTPFAREPDFGVTSLNYDLGELLAKGAKPGE